SGSRCPGEDCCAPGSTAASFPDNCALIHGPPAQKFGGVRRCTESAAASAPPCHPAPAISRPGVVPMATVGVVPRSCRRKGLLLVIRALRGRRQPFFAALAALGLASLAVAPAASADTTRTLNLAISCATGLPYGL